MTRTVKILFILLSSLFSFCNFAEESQDKYFSFNSYLGVVDSSNKDKLQKHLSVYLQVVKNYKSESPIKSNQTILQLVKAGNNLIYGYALEKETKNANDVFSNLLEATKNNTNPEINLILQKAKSNLCIAYIYSDDLKNTKVVFDQLTQFVINSESQFNDTINRQKLLLLFYEPSFRYINMILQNGNYQEAKKIYETMVKLSRNLDLDSFEVSADLTFYQVIAQFLLLKNSYKNTTEEFYDHYREVIELAKKAQTLNYENEPDFFKIRMQSLLYISERKELSQKIIKMLTQETSDLLPLVNNTEDSAWLNKIAERMDAETQKINAKLSQPPVQKPLQKSQPKPQEKASPPAVSVSPPTSSTSSSKTVNNILLQIRSITLSGLELTQLTIGELDDLYALLVNQIKNVNDSDPQAESNALLQLRAISLIIDYYYINSKIQDSRKYYMELKNIAQRASFMKYKKLSTFTGQIKKYQNLFGW